MKGKKKWADRISAAGAILGVGILGVVVYMTGNPFALVAICFFAIFSIIMAEVLRSQSAEWQRLCGEYSEQLDRLMENSLRLIKTNKRMQ